MTTIKDGCKNEIQSEDTTVEISEETQNDVDHPMYRNVAVQYIDDNYERQKTKIYLEEIDYKEKQLPQHQQTFIVAPAYRRQDSDSYDDLSFSSFDDVRTRHRFVRKVFAILFVQLACTVIAMCLAMFVTEVKYFIIVNRKTVLIVIAVISILSTLIILSSKEARTVFPINYILLAIFTVAMSFGVQTTIAYVDPLNVLIVLAITTGVCMCVIIFAIQTKLDISGYGAYVFVAIMVLNFAGLVLGLRYFVGFDMRIAHIIYTMAGILVFSCYLIFAVQQVVGGKLVHLSEEEYILGAMIIYLGIILLFLEILRLVALLKNERHGTGNPSRSLRNWQRELRFDHWIATRRDSDNDDNH